MRESCTKCNIVSLTSTLSSEFLQKLQQCAKVSNKFRKILQYVQHCGSMEADSAEILHKLQPQVAITVTVAVTAHCSYIPSPPLRTKSPAPLQGLRDFLHFTLCSRGSPPSKRLSTEVRSSACYPALFMAEICPTPRHPSPARRSPAYRPRSSAGAGHGCGGSGRRADRR